MNYPYCNLPLFHEIYQMKPGQLQYILFCENEDCPVKPCTDATTPSKAIKEIENMRTKKNQLKDLSDVPYAIAKQDGKIILRLGHRRNTRKDVGLKIAPCKVIK